MNVDCQNEYAQIHVEHQNQGIDTSRDSEDENIETNTHCQDDVTCKFLIPNIIIINTRDSNGLPGITKDGSLKSKS